MTDLTSLVDRLEQAESGSRELDEDIAIAISLWKPWLSKHRYWNFDGSGDLKFSWPQDGIPEFNSQTGERIVLTEKPWHGWADKADIPEWTASLDAALTLVPDGWEWEMRFNDGRAFADIGDPNLFCVGESSTPAVAIVIASLKARSRAEGK